MWAGILGLCLLYAARAKIRSFTTLPINMELAGERFTPWCATPRVLLCRCSSGENNVLITAVLRALKI
jgi:hypothetical protein